MNEITKVSPRWEVDRAPFALRCYYGDHMVLQSGWGEAGAIRMPGAFQRDGTWRYVTAIVDEESTVSGIIYRCATTDPAFQVYLTITPSADGITVRWEPADGLTCESIGDVYEIAGAGHWYGHGYHEPQHWPLERGGVGHDPFLCNNVQCPIWLTSGGAGIIIPTEELLSVSLNRDSDGLFRIGMKDVSVFTYQVLVGKDIVDLFYRMINIVGKPERLPPPETFALPIYSTWTQYPRHITQQKVLDFARQIVDAGLPVGVLEIDEKYQPSFGEIAFDPAIFPDPAAMLRELHEMGFVVTLWTSPFINIDSPAFSELRERGGLVLDVRTGEPGVFTWWAGQAGLLDVTSPGGEGWYVEKLQAMRDLGFAGFKFDGGDGKYAPPFATTRYHQPQRPQGYSNRYLEFIARQFPDYAESRVAWMVQRAGLLIREGGKDTRWGLDNGLHALITQGLTQGLLGYPYLICDMIPGRVQTRFPDAPLPADELFTRWVETSAFTPIMQFSYGPWNYAAMTLAVTRAYARLHAALGEYLHVAAEEAVQKGTPIMRPLFFSDPADMATYLIDDEFLLGADLLVAPVVTEGAITRSVYLPCGEWRDAWSGDIHAGGITLEHHPAPCPGIPLFIRQGSAWSDALAAILTAHLPRAQRGHIPSGVTTTTYSATLARTI